MQQAMTQASQEPRNKELVQALKEQYTAMSDSYTGSGISQLTPPPSSAWTGVSYPSYGSLTTTSRAYNPSPYVSDADEWQDRDNQEAAGMGWMLTSGQYSPKVVALHFGAKKDWSEEKVLQDVVEKAMMGECPIAYKILCLISRNRSPYKEWTDTCTALKASYEK